MDVTIGKAHIVIDTGPSATAAAAAAVCDSRAPRSQVPPQLGTCRLCGSSSNVDVYREPFIVLIGPGSSTFGVVIGCAR